MNVRLPLFLRRNLLRKVMALFFAVLIWLAVYNRIHYATETLHDLEINVIRKVESTVYLNNSLPKVTVELEGPASELERISPSEVQPFVDISDFSAGGEYRIPVNVRILRNADISVRRTRPSRLPVSLKEKETN